MLMGPSFRYLAATLLLVCSCNLITPLKLSGIKIIELPKGELIWTTERPRKAKMCIPAAFTGLPGSIMGEYRLNGVVHNRNKKTYRISICKDNFYVDKKWLTDNGFQQYVLVLNGKASHYGDSRKTVRRAICKKDNHIFLVESRYPMTMSGFAAECAKVSACAVYLDMGEYGYGYVGSRILSLWAYFSRDKQTNWLCIY